MLPTITIKQNQAITRVSGRNIDIVGYRSSRLSGYPEHGSVGSVSSKASGGGAVESSLSYRLDTIITKKHTDIRGIYLSFSQPIGPGCFGIGGDPWINARNSIYENGVKLCEAEWRIYP
jgi:hypothetical protein